MKNKNVKHCTETVQKDVILNLFQNLHSLFKPGDAGSGSGMTKLSLFVYLILFGTSAIAQDTSVKWHSFEEAIQLAEETQQPVLVDVWAPWCGWCKKMQKEVYPAMSDYLSSQFVLTRLNRDDNETNHRYLNRNFTSLRLAQELNVQSVPGLVILSSDGKYLTHITGFTKTKDLRTFLEYLTEQGFD